ncbi:MAG TPA: hypothetical protein PK413_14275, partial [Thermoanaerobaculia bacterium]|nr:hypothetical protein [Thermoanaerobaculia bacterium]
MPLKDFSASTGFDRSGVGMLGLEGPIMNLTEQPADGRPAARPNGSAPATLSRPARAGFALLLGGVLAVPWVFSVAAGPLTPHGTHPPLANPIFEP